MSDDLAALRAQLDRIEQLLNTPTEPRFVKVAEAARILGVGRDAIYTALDNGSLWKVEGLGTSTVLIPMVAIEALQQRPRHLSAVAS